MKEAAKTGAIITLTNDIDLTSDLTFKNNVEINGQGFAINNHRVLFEGESVSLRNTKFIGAAADTYEASNVYVQGNNKIFVADNCEFSASEYEGIQYTSENATSVTINNCIFKTSNNIARAIHLQVKEVSDAQVVITNNKIFNGDKYASNSGDKDIVCVYGFAAANMTLEGNVVYDVTALDEVLIWISNGFGETIGTAGFELGGKSAATTDAFEAALESVGEVTLTSDITTTKTANLLAGSTLDGGNNTLFMKDIVADGALALGLKVAGGTIQNITIDGNNQRSVNTNKGYRAVYIEKPTENVVIDNVHIKGVLYAINTGNAGDEGLTLSVSNSTLEGWSSWSVFKSAEFKNCKFPVGSYYSEESIYNQGLAPYVDTVFENCEFSKGHYFDLTKFTDTKLTFKNCTVGGKKITKEMFAKLASPYNGLASELELGKYFWFEEGTNMTIDKITIE